MSETAPASDYFAMGGYAGFIWPSYGLALILLVGLAVVAYRRLRAAERMDSGARHEAETSDTDRAS